MTRSQAARVRYVSTGRSAAHTRSRAADIDELYPAETTGRRTRSTATGVHFHAPLPIRREREASPTPSLSPPEEESPLDVEVMSYDSLDAGYDQIHDRVGDNFTLSIHDFEHRPDNNFDYSRNDNLVNQNDNFGTQFESTLRD